MRLLGLIWRVSPNNDIDTIAIQHGPHSPKVGVDRLHMLTPIFRLQAGRYVTFEMLQQAGEYKGQNVLLLQDETDLKMLASLSLKANEDIWIPAVIQQMKILPVAEAIHAVIACLNARPNEQGTTRLVLKIPDRLLEVSRHLRSMVSISERFRICGQLMAANIDANHQDMITEELFPDLIKLKIEHQHQCLALLPKKVFASYPMLQIHPGKDANLSDYIPYIQIFEEITPKISEALLQKMSSSTSYEISKFSKTIPYPVLRSWAALRAAIPVPNRIPLYIDLVTNHWPLDPDVTRELLEAIPLATPEGTDAFLFATPTKILREWEALRDTLQPSFRIQAYARLLNEQSENNDWVIHDLAQALAIVDDVAKELFAKEVAYNILLRETSLRLKLTPNARLDLVAQLLQELRASNNQTALKEAIETWQDEIMSVVGLAAPEAVLAFARAVPVSKIVLWKELRNALAPEDHLRLCMSMWQSDRPDVVKAHLRHEIIDVLDALPSKNRSWQTVPIEFLCEKRSFRRHLSQQDHLDYLVAQLINDAVKSESEELVNELREILIHVQNPQFWQEIPLDILIHEQIRSSAPRHLLVQRLVKAIQEEQSKTYLVVLSELIERANDGEVAHLLKHVPIQVQRLEPVVWKLPVLEQVAAVGSLAQDTPFAKWQHVWRHLPAEVCLLYIYYVAQTRVYGEMALMAMEEQQPIVRAALILLSAITAQPATRPHLFDQAHQILEAHIVEKAWETDSELRLDNLLPRCQPQVVHYCEARPWPTPQDKDSKSERASRAFCPRTRSECAITKDVGKMHLAANAAGTTMQKGAQLYANCDKHWREWSLLELLECLQLPSVLHGIAPSDYVRKLSGWVNRLNEIRELLRCTTCRDTMVPNTKYAKFLARFNMTVASCRHGDGHDHNIYFNQCWACETIVDSRTSPVRREKYYLCTNCGSGPQYSDVYIQGSVCPKCESPDLNRVGGSLQKRQCDACHHTFQLPEQKKITGPGSSRMCRERHEDY